jgi:Tfp pilus assembly protein PilO
MSYAIRNTLILLVALLLIYGVGYAYMKFFQIDEIDRLEVRLTQLESDYNQQRQTADLVPMLREQFEESQRFIDGFDKTIFRNNNPDEVFRFLSLLNQMAGLDFNFAFRDSTVTSDYGIIRSEITGSGSYRGLMTFVNAIENSEPVQKIYDVSLTPVGQTGSFQNVNFVFHIRSKYDSNKMFNSDRTPGISTRTLASAHNPFFPLIRTPDPNEDNLPDIDNSRLIGVSASTIFLLNQDGRMVTLRPNDRVYLGRLESINVQQGNATFRLNRGGIIDVVTLEVQR